MQSNTLLSCGCTQVASPSCGGTSFFVGTTRDSFNGRVVLRLEYESYDEMAYNVSLEFHILQMRTPSIQAFLKV